MLLLKIKPKCTNPHGKSSLLSDVYETTKVSDVTMQAVSTPHVVLIQTPDLCLFRKYHVNIYILQ